MPDAATIDTLIDTMMPVDGISGLMLPLLLGALTALLLYHRYQMQRHHDRHRQDAHNLAVLSDHDALTGLPNRACFERQAVQYLQRNETALLVFLNLDDFKLINDSLGHRVGDQTLQVTARRLREMAGESALVARYSGDEFVLLLPAFAEGRTVAWADRLLAIMRQPVVFNDLELMLSSSIGLARWPQDCAMQSGTDSPESQTEVQVESLIRSADLAMCEAKRAGKNKVCSYHARLLTAQNHTADIASRLRRLNPDEELSLVFQPRMELATRQLRGAEVLLRWRTAEGEQISPASFIPVAEETGQILRLGYWVMEQACQALARWPVQADPLVLSINLSARQLLDAHLVDRIEALRERYHLSAAQLEFEVTESSAMGDMVGALHVLGRLRARGYGLSLDDFGTGFSSLSHLRSLPVDTLKIDRSFICNLENERLDRVLVASIIELAGNLGLRVLAEGVETLDQLTLLDSLGCDEVQGYFIARPMPEASFLEVLVQRPA
ncbi:bifunctional diguanylate cyclase/phosphodiesterase [Alcanivorax sp. JB21]|uniref:putative bifunctional diguanylate cyclase/phosphodiesterase n=1 Tax=Alcanivorax limicola TaxID=2874102 RepID=UPI001CBCD030|nr:bifunctional diguanylate cyclase/phosphodiesterase [Alcanivorax limicola]MBZ2188201.1 bifunctional diguanylate cyclase/phosphodiesterase [Alcanivorax limicola]